MAKLQASKMQTGEERGDGLREKMVAINRVTKVVKGGRVLGFAALTVVGDGDGGIGMGKGNSGSMTPDDLLAACTSVTTPTGPVFYGAGRWLPGDPWSNGWPFAGYDATQYNHVAPPNWNGIDCGSNSYIPDAPDEGAIVAARSEHVGSVVVGFGDGHTQVVADSVDPLVWRAAGSRNGEDTIDGNL